MKRGTLIIFGMLAAALLSGGLFAGEAALKAAGLDEKSCLDRGGKWKFYGELQKEGCSVPTKDHGKFCSDSAECEGACIAELDATQKSELKRGGRRFGLKGKCSEWTLNNGCHSFVHKGFVTSIDCIESKRKV